MLRVAVGPGHGTSADQLKSRKIPFNTIKPNETTYFAESGPQRQA